MYIATLVPNKVGAQLNDVLLKPSSTDAENILSILSKMRITDIPSEWQTGLQKIAGVKDQILGLQSQFRDLTLEDLLTPTQGPIL